MQEETPCQRDGQQADQEGLEFPVENPPFYFLDVRQAA